MSHIDTAYHLGALAAQEKIAEEEKKGFTLIEALILAGGIGVPAAYMGNRAATADREPVSMGRRALRGAATGTAGVLGGAFGGGMGAWAGSHLPGRLQAPGAMLGGLAGAIGGGYIGGHTAGDQLTPGAAPKPPAPPQPAPPQPTPPQGT